MTDAPKKRPFFQFHLGTAIMVMLVAAALLPIIVGVAENWVADAERGEIYVYRVRHYMIILIGCAAVIVLTAAVCEWLIRRKERRP
jgi:predicted membrane-bound mannosyltransferase